MKSFNIFILLLLILFGLFTSLYAVTVTIGDGTNYNNTIQSPTPYGTYYKNFRQQYLFTANDLIAAGAGGDLRTITALSFNVQAINDCSPMQNYRIRLMQTTAIDLENTFTQDGTYTEVWSSTNYIPVVGWNLHTLTTPFIWDGSSSIIVDIVTALMPGISTQNASVYCTTIPGSIICKRYQSNTINAATYSGNGSTSFNRANMKFEMENALFTDIYSGLAF